ncbi:MAG: GNAT family N-acetyltransferase [Polyangiaceae bacterium]
MTTLFTKRLELRPITVDLVEAVLSERRDDVRRIVGAELPPAWPGRALVERAFSASIEAIRRDPEHRLWGDRLVLTRPELGPPRLVGSVVFHGSPRDGGVIEIGYGVEESSQGMGYATEATTCQVEWALAQAEVRRIEATTPPWHSASVRVLEKAGFTNVGLDDHPFLGEVLRFARDRT